MISHGQNLLGAYIKADLGRRTTGSHDKCPQANPSTFFQDRFKSCFDTQDLVESFPNIPELLK